MYMCVQVSAGAGGQESMLFASEIFNMYSNYAQYKGWTFDVTTELRMDLGLSNFTGFLLHSTYFKCVCALCRFDVQSIVYQ